MFDSGVHADEPRRAPTMVIPFVIRRDDPAIAILSHSLSRSSFGAARDGFFYRRDRRERRELTGEKKTSASSARAAVKKFSAP
jgi:hypothetical protein